MSEPTDLKRDSEELEMDSAKEAEVQAAEMAAAMGFSGFGKAPPPKKRKYNPKTDAFIDGQELEKIDRGGKKGQGSGGNQIPLGKRRVLGEKVLEERIGNEEEMVLNDDEDEDTEDRPMEERCLDTSRPPPIEAPFPNAKIESTEKIAAVDNNKKPLSEAIQAAIKKRDEQLADLKRRAYAQLIEVNDPAETEKRLAALDHSSDFDHASLWSSSTDDMTPKKKEKREQAEKPKGLSAFVAKLRAPDVPSSSIPPAPGTSTSTSTVIPPAPGTSHASLRQRPPPSESGFSESSRGWGERGQRNELWYVDYYDHSFNENPWAGLEKKLGLESVGTWVERPARTAQQQRG